MESTAPGQLTCRGGTNFVRHLLNVRWTLSTDQMNVTRRTIWRNNRALLGVRLSGEAIQFNPITTQFVNRSHTERDCVRAGLQPYVVERVRIR